MIGNQIPLKMAKKKKIETFEHNCGGQAWILTHPNQLIDLEEVAQGLLSERHINILTDPMAYLEYLLEKITFPNAKEWLESLKKSKQIALEIYGEGYVDAQVWVRFYLNKKQQPAISLEERPEQLHLIKNDYLRNIATYLGEIDPGDGYMSGAFFNPFPKQYLYGSFCGEMLDIDPHTQQTFWDFETEGHSGSKNLPHVCIDDFLEEFFEACLQNVYIQPSRSFE